MVAIARPIAYKYSHISGRMRDAPVCPIEIEHRYRVSRTAEPNEKNAKNKPHLACHPNVLRWPIDTCNSWTDAQPLDYCQILCSSFLCAMAFGVYCSIASGGDRTVRDKREWQRTSLDANTWMKKWNTTNANAVLFQPFWSAIHERFVGQAHRPPTAWFSFFFGGRKNDAQKCRVSSVESVSQSVKRWS